MLKSFISCTLLSLSLVSTLSYADINNKPVTIDVAAIENDIKSMFEEAINATEANDKEKAIKLFTAITNKYPDVPEPYNNLAVLYVEKGQYELAIQSLRTAIKFNPNYATAKENLGDIYMKLATDSYNSAVAGNPANKAVEKKANLAQQILNPNKTQVASNAPVNVSPTPVAMPTKTNITPVVQTVDSTPDNNTIKTEVNSFIKSWASAWANKDAQAYLKSYDINFETPGGVNRQEWNNSRIDRISKAKKIVVDLSDVKISVNSPTTATITFSQFYRSDNYKDNTKKSVDVVKTNNSWYIVRETTISN